MRKVKRCDVVYLEQRPTLRMRKCLKPRGHEGESHLDEHGSWKEPE